MTSVDPLSRRTFLALTGALASACARGGAPPARVAAATSLSSAKPWETVRALFPLTRDHVHLASFLLASHPKPVADAIERYRRELDANPVLTLEREFASNKQSTRVRANASAYMGVAPDEIAQTDSTTMGLATLYNGIRLGPGDEILTTTHDHYSTHESLRLAAARTGATLRKVALYGDSAAATEDGMTAALEGALTPRTRVVAITWVHSSTGVKTPVRRIADALARAQASREPRERALLCVDGVHGFGVEDATMPDLGCDFFVAGCHKWIYGPRGTGILWGRADAMRGLLPTIPPFFGAWWTAREYGGEPPPIDGRVMSPGGFKSFEHYWALADAFALHQEIGKSRIQARIHELNRHAKEGLAAMKHVTMRTPMSSAVSSGIVCFEVAGMKPDAVVDKLSAAKVIGSVTPYRPSFVRIAASLVNDHEDVDAALRVIRALG